MPKVTIKGVLEHHYRELPKQYDKGQTAAYMGWERVGVNPHKPTKCGFPKVISNGGPSAFRFDPSRH